VASWYDQFAGEAGSEYHQKVIIPGIERMLHRQATTGTRGRPLFGLRVLDLACGQGAVARALARQGAEVTAVDAAAELVEAGRRRDLADQLPITYRVADVTKLAQADGQAEAALGPAGSFDAALVVLAIQNLTPLSPVWQACRWGLRPGGSVIVVMMHPCFRVPKHSDWHFDEAAGRQSRTVSTYLTSSHIDIQTHPGRAASGGASESTTHFHRPLQAYINTLSAAGLLVDHIEEWASHKRSGKGPKAVEIDRARAEIPMIQALRARRIHHEDAKDAKGS
jgi:2-polyprenyl-3-methyl-5-hydroxy-6-metoxy-1,4-benzoquinol methylase